MDSPIIPVENAQHIEAIKALFLEYQEYQEPLGVQLEFQNFKEEMANLPGSYKPPEGNLYLAWHLGQPVGCAAFYKLLDGVCEIKRVFVRPTSQGLGLGKALLKRVLLDAKSAGYRFARLDSVRRLHKAANMYIKYGFYEIASFNTNPNKDVYYMEFNLSALKDTEDENPCVHSPMLCSATTDIYKL